MLYFNVTMKKQLPPWKTARYMLLEMYVTGIAISLSKWISKIGVHERFGSIERHPTIKICFRFVNLLDIILATEHDFTLYL